jgi:hypothetical protein
MAARHTLYGMRKTVVMDVNLTLLGESYPLPACCISHIEPQGVNQTVKYGTMVLGLSCHMLKERINLLQLYTSFL